MLAYLSPILALCWPILAPCWPYLGPMLAHLGPMLALCWPMLALGWPMLAPCWPILGPLLALAWAFFWPSMLQHLQDANFSDFFPLPGAQNHVKTTVFARRQDKIRGRRGARNTVKNGVFERETQNSMENYRLQVRPGVEPRSGQGRAKVGPRSTQGRSAAGGVRAYNLRLPPKASGEHTGPGPAPGSVIEWASARVPPTPQSGGMSWPGWGKFICLVLMIICMSFDLKILQVSTSNAESLKLQSLKCIWGVLKVCGQEGSTLTIDARRLSK